MSMTVLIMPKRVLIMSMTGLIMPVRVLIMSMTVLIMPMRVLIMSMTLLEYLEAGRCFGKEQNVSTVMVPD